MANEMKQRWLRWIQLICLCLSGGVIYVIYNLRPTFYLTMNEALGITNTQSGVMASAYGIVQMLSFLLGGWLADRVSARKLLTISLVMTGLGGLYFSTFPSFSMAVGVFIWFGVFNNLTFYAVMIKATRQWASSQDQGKAFGLLEGGRGLISSLVLMGVVALFASLGSSIEALRSVILITSIVNIVIGIPVWLVFKDTEPVDSANKSGGWDLIKQALKMPETWLISIIILGPYMALNGTYYITPYATQVYGGSLVLGAILQGVRQWVRPLVGTGAGFLADKVGTSRLVIITSIILIINMLVFVLVPGSPALISVLIVNTVVIYLAIAAGRGLFFALLEEGNVPLALTGTIVGIVTAIAYSPDIYFPILAGVLLDKYPAVLAYRYMFTGIAIFLAISVVAAIVFRQRR